MFDDLVPVYPTNKFDDLLPVHRIYFMTVKDEVGDLIQKNKSKWLLAGNTYSA